MAFQTPQKQMSFSRELRAVLQERNLLSAKSREKVCSMLNDSAVASSTPIDKMDEKTDKLGDYRRQAVLEILSSERAYLAQLEMLMKYFVLPLKENAIINQSSHRLLFGQIEMIYNLNSEFLRTLEAEEEKVAHAFLKMAPFFKLYCAYAFDYNKALLVLQDLTNKNLSFRKYLEQTESRPEVQRKLMSLLIVPIQRVPRYKLLLQQVSFYTSPADPDRNFLRESIKEIEDTANHINSCVQDQEVIQVLLNLQNSLRNRMPYIVQPSRKVIKEGMLQKVTHNGTGIKRYCVLMSDIFLYCKILKERRVNTHVENSLECCCIFPLNKCKVYELLPGNFKITCRGDGIIFSTTDLHLEREWVTLLKDAIESHLQCRKTLRKDSSKRTPLRRKAAKHFGAEYVLSPKAKRGEYDTVFRGDKRSSDSEGTDESSTKKNKCFPFNRRESGSGKEIKCRERRQHCDGDGLKRRASSPSASRDTKIPSRFSLEHFPCLPTQQVSQFNNHNSVAVSILKPKLGNKDNNRFYNETRFQHGILMHKQTEGAVLSPPLKKRVKFDDLQNNILPDDIGITESIATNDWTEHCVPLHSKIWKFVTGFFQKKSNT